MKIATIVGARPQFIKAAAVHRAIGRRNKEAGGEEVREVLIHTGQHYDSNMSQVFFDELEIPQADYHLGIGGSSHGVMTGKMLQEIEPILIKEKPDWVLIYGDTNSTLAGALAAVKLHIPVAHVEAGLRSFNRKMPEEINRMVADSCADLLFTPTATATEQLRREGVSSDKVRQVGDVMYDVALYYRHRAKQNNQLLMQLGLTPKGYALATVHRQENTDNPVKLKEIFLGLAAIAEGLPVVVPLHPRTRQVLQKVGLYSEVEKKVRLIDPVGYLDMIQLEGEAKVILTDSGGVQKEAFFFQVPCLTLREETEWVELVDNGFNELVPLHSEQIVSAFHRCQRQPRQWGKNLYGEGKASDDILAHLRNAGISR